jgi:hypothetical protein
MDGGWWCRPDGSAILMIDETEYGRLDVLGQSLAAKRTEAVEYRDTLGLGTFWDKAQDAYDGIDDANRAESQYQKPTSMSGRLTGSVPADGGKSTVYVNITQPYVDMAAARVADLLLPTDDKPFGLDPTPIPELDEYENSDGIETFEDGSQAPVADIAKVIWEQATERAEKAETRIWDWLVESQWHAEVRRVIEDAARLGVGVLKGPVPVKRKIQKIVRGEYGLEPAVEAIPRPCSKRIDPDNLFPAKGCGEDIHSGSYLFERDYLSTKQLRALRGGDYLDEQIDICLKEGPNGPSEYSPADRDKKELYEIWYCHATLDPEDMSAAGCECTEEVPAIITMVNDRVIKAAVSPLDSGKFPYDVMPWQRKKGTWAGIGIAHQVNAPQRMINAATRAMLNNAALSAGPMIFMRRKGIEPADKGPMALLPLRIFYVDDLDTRRVEDAVKAILIPSAQKELMGIIEYSLAMAERLTNMPLMMQGQQGDASETVGGMQILQNNSSAVLRRIATLFDDNITEPHIRAYYEWLLLYGDDAEKCDVQINAKGSSALFERDAQNQAILQMAAVVKDPAFEINPAKWIIEAFKAQKLDPSRFQYTEDEKKRMQEAQAQQPPQDPRVTASLEVANVKAQTDMQKEELRQNAIQAKAEIDRQEAEAQRQHETNLALVKRDTEMVKLAQAGKMSLEEIKAKLTTESMKLNVQKELAGKAQVATPPTEPPGRAEDGRAYEQ